MYRTRLPANCPPLGAQIPRSASYRRLLCLLPFAGADTSLNLPRPARPAAAKAGRKPTEWDRRCPTQTPPSHRPQSTGFSCCRCSLPPRRSGARSYRGCAPLMGAPAQYSINRRVVAWRTIWRRDGLPCKPPDVRKVRFGPMGITCRVKYWVLRHNRETTDRREVFNRIDAALRAKDINLKPLAGLSSLCPAGHPPPFT